MKKLKYIFTCQKLTLLSNTLYMFFIMFLVILAIFNTNIKSNAFKQSSCQVLKDQTLKNYYNNNIEQTIDQEWKDLGYISEIKIAIIMSYDMKDPYGRPQQLSFVNELTSLKNDIFWNIETYYLRSKVHNISSDELDFQIKNALIFVRTMNPDIIVTIDDLAFEKIGAPLSKEGYKVFFSGLNIPISYYKGKYNENNVSGIIESDSGINYFIDLLDNYRLTHIFQKAYIITSYHPTITENFIIDKYMKVFKSRIPVYVVNFKTTEHLNFWLKANNKLKERYIYLFTADRIYDTYHKSMIGTLDIANQLTNINHKHFEYSSNPILSQYSKIMMSIGPNPFNMGKMLSYLVFSYSTNKEKYIKTIKYPDISISVNIKQTKKNKYGFVYNTLEEYITHVY